MPVRSVSPLGQSLMVKKNGLWFSFRKYWMLYLMFLPTVITLVIFNYIPMWGVTLAFKDYVPW